MLRELRRNFVIDLTGKLLIAMPGMGDPRFERSVVFLCAHNPDGAMGLIVNNAAGDIRFADLLEQLSISVSPGVTLPEIQLGGPVEHGRGFVLHSAEYGASATTLQVDQVFGMTATLDVLEDIANGEGPNEYLLALGYSGWGPGQLEDELRQSAWLVGDTTPDLIFKVPAKRRWEAALRLNGIDVSVLSANGGTA